jgi:signal transduction histidine kinase
LNTSDVRPVASPARPTPLGTIVRILCAPFSRWTWAEFLYAMLRLPLGVIGFVMTVVSLVVGVVLSATFFGLPLIVLGSFTARGLGVVHRLLARGLLGLNVAGAAPFRAGGSGFYGWLRSGLRDVAGWRARSFLVLQFPVALVCFLLAIGLRIAGVEFLCAPLFWRLYGDSPNGSLNGFVHHPVFQFGHVRFDTWPRVTLLSALGLLLLMVTPWAVHFVLLLEKSLIRWLLGPISLTERVRDLEQSRAKVVDDAAARLRRIERDLHDGTQAQLVAVAMKLSLARDRLKTGASATDVARALELVDTAHITTKEAIGELRDLVRGIHPPVLDNGLAAALATLAARSPIPAELAADLPVRPSPSIETIAYFCVTELLTNVVKHSGAHRVTIEVTGSGKGLRLRVTDDGVGGAVPGPNTGLSGLTDRVRMVDGRLTIHSPAGGPTVIRIDLPTHA